MHRLKDDELAELLIRAGADLNSTDFYGHTPLWYVTYCTCQLSTCMTCTFSFLSLFLGWPQKDKGLCL